MPILPAEPDRYPSDLLELSVDPARSWYVLHTRPRQEKSLARQLQAAAVPHFLPSVPRSCRVRNRTMTAYVPLFPSYLFLLADREERVTALATDRVVNTLPVVDRVELLRDLRQIDQLLASGLPVESESKLEPGTPVEITTGPLAGMRGEIIRSGTGRRFVVRVDFIHQGASVMLEDCALLPLRRSEVGAI